MQLIKELVGLNNSQSVVEEQKVRELIFEYIFKDNSPERVKLQEEYKRGAPLTGEYGLRKKLGALDIEYFGRAYLPHYFFRKSPVFHNDLDLIWTKGVLKLRIPEDKETVKEILMLPGCREAVAAPRGHAKSTNLTFKDSLHAVVYEYKKYIILLSDSSDQAEGFLGNIREEFEENEALKLDFGDLVGNKVWRNDVIITRSGIKIEALGAGKKIRGRKHKSRRPDLIVLDDIENDENVRTPEQRKKYCSLICAAQTIFLYFIYLVFNQ